MESGISSHVQAFLHKFEQHQEVARNKGTDVQRTSSLCPQNDPAIETMMEVGWLSSFGMCVCVLPRLC